MDKTLMAVDIGAGSGRIFTGAYDGERLSIQEECRFVHRPVRVGNEIYLNFLGIWDAVRKGMAASAKKNGAIVSAGIDSFTPDFCMVDPGGTFVGNMLSYRTMLGSGVLKEVLKQSDPWELFQYTGLQANEILMLPQLLHMYKGNQKWMLEQCKALPLANAIEYLLTGEISMDFTAASVTMLWDSRKRDLSSELIRRFLGKADFFPKIEKNQSIKGTVGGLYKDEGIEGIRIINSGVHDTAAATYALNLMAKGQICMNCGTWTSISIVVDEPIINKTAFSCGLTNYGLPDGTYMFGTVMLGLFYLQECKEEWAAEGKDYSYETLTRMAMDARGFNMDLDDPVFAEDQSLVTRRIQAYFARRGMEAPQTTGEYVHCIIKSLVLKYKRTIELLETATGCCFEKIYMGGGGTKSELLLSLMGQIIGKEIICSASEITVMGNLLSQLIALDEIHADDAGQILCASFEINE